MRKLMQAAAIALAIFTVSVSPSQALELGQVRAQLRETAINDLTLADESIVSVLETLASISGLDFVASDTLLKESPTVNLEITSKISLAEFLKMIEKSTKVRFWYSDGVIVAHSPEEKVQKPVLEVYQVGNLEIVSKDFPGQGLNLNSPGRGGGGAPSILGGASESAGADIPIEDLPDMIKTFTGESGKYWENNEDATVEIKGKDLLVVRAIIPVQIEVQKLLAQLRQ